MAGANVLNTQLQTGEFEQPSIATAVNDSGAMSISLSGGEDTLGDSAVKSKGRKCKVAKYSKTKCDQRTQTELSTVSATVIVGQGSLEDTYQKSCEYKEHLQAF